MLDTSRIEQLVAQWESLMEQGHPIPVEELCADCPELLPEVRKRIEELPPSDVEETMAAEIGAMATVIEQARSDDSDPGALVMKSRYRKLRFHAKGGLGEVYVADDNDLQRDVAVKFMQARHRDRRECHEQFLLEAEVTARLDHPGVVPVYGFGKTPDGRPCYAMRFIQGATLEDRIAKLHSPQPPDASGRRGDPSPFSADRAVEFRSLLTRFVSICQTIAYAHNRGILHRDIKPENVMLGKYGDTLVVDWGLAMPIDRDDSARASGEETLMPMAGSGSSSGYSHGPVGTPAYMSPEQAAGAGMLTPATDIFALGCTLYRLLVGQAPYTGSGKHEVLAKARAASFTPPREINRRVPRALEAVCLRAMAFDPAQRYITALEMADDLERWLADEPVKACQDTLPERIGRWLRHHRVLTLSLLSSLLIVLLLATLAALGQRQVAKNERSAREVTQLAHEDSLKLTARFIARAVSKDLQSHWLVLQKAALDPEFRDIVARLNGTKDMLPPRGDTELQLWLSNHRSALSTGRSPLGEANWVVCLQDGTLAGRAPQSDQVGQRFHYRDYFHGLGRDLDKDSREAAEARPLRAPHRSNVFLSTTTNEWMVAMSVPVFAPQSGSASQEVIGVLVMTQKLGDFDVLKDRNGDDRVLQLIDTGEDANGTRGTVLYDSRATSPEWLEAQATGSFASETRRITGAQLDALIKLRAVRRLQEEQSAGSRSLRADTLLETEHVDYSDASQRWIAASEAIIFRRVAEPGASADTAPIEDTGWIVIVKTPHE